MNLGLFVNGSRGLSILKTALEDERLSIDWVILPSIASNIGEFTRVVSEKCQVYKVEKFKDLEKISRFCSEVDMVVVAGFPLRIPRHFINKSRILSCNLHGGPLPSYRGGSPLNWQMINGEKTVTLSIHILEDDFDSGDVLMTTEFDILENWDISDLQEKANRYFCEMFKKLIVSPASFVEKKRQQSQLNIRYWHQRSSEDGEVCWKNLDSFQVNRFVKSITHPYPGAYSKLASGHIVRIWSVRVDEVPICGVAGRIVVLKDTPHVVCSNGSSVTLVNFESELKLHSGMRFT